MKKKVKRNKLTLTSKNIGPLPILNRFIDRLKLHNDLNGYVPSKPNMSLSNANAILILVRNILIEREPLYNLAAWAQKFESGWVGLGNASTKVLNDDRIGRSLDALFQSDRSTLLTEIVLRTISEFNIDLSQLHNDSTSVTVYGKYGRPPTYKGKPTVRITHGHNKDHRPDLKQLVFSLTVSSDGAVPIHYKALDGNITDDKTHINNWENLCRITKRKNFIYVADCKLCTKEQMGYIHREGGRFITVLPKNRNEQKWFEKWIRENKIHWQELYRTPNHRRPFSDDETIYYGFESPLPSNEGYRIIWIFSTQKQELDQQTRQRKIKKSIKALADLSKKVGKGRLKIKEQITGGINNILKDIGAQKYFSWNVYSEDITEYKQKGMGRPGKKTKYLKIINKRWDFTAVPNEKIIQDEAVMDGIFPLITNIRRNEMTKQEVLKKYKYQPFIEKRHEQFKSVFEAVPVFLKAPHRVEALMFIYFIVLLLNALIERELRMAMKKKKIKFLPIYPEDRKCEKPTTERILKMFVDHRHHILKNGEKPIKKFHDSLTKNQKIVLNLLNVKTVPYEK